jgi:transcriptional regulator with GAF, ATPase, and Fis domain
MADGGTLFLDEIGELGAPVQSKLLRVLQERAFERVGGNRTVRVDVRLVAATNRDLHAAVARRDFREDLYFRLAVVALTVPPLRSRAADVETLARHFLERFGREVGRERIRFSDAALAALRSHPWPGNVRELENCVERAVILADGDVLEPDHLGLGGNARRRTGDDEAFARAVGLEGSLDETVDRARALAETLRIRDALERADGNKTRAAELLEVNYKRLLARIRELDLDGS